MKQMKCMLLLSTALMAPAMHAESKIVGKPKIDTMKKVFRISWRAAEVVCGCTLFGAWNELFSFGDTRYEEGKSKKSPHRRVYFIGGLSLLVDGLCGLNKELGIMEALQRKTQVA